MPELVWILDSRKGSFFGNKGVSSNYIVPKNDLGVDQKLLAGNILWVVLRGNEDRLLIVIKIKKVERILEEYHSDDFLISAELTESFKLISDYSAATKYKVANTRALSLGISEIGFDVSETFRLLVKSTIQVKLTSIPEKLFTNIDLQPLPHNRSQLAKVAIRTITAHLTLDQVWASGTGDKLGAFANFAYSIFVKKTSSQQVAELVSELKNFDPISILFRQIATKDHARDKADKSKPPSVDIEFTEIEPNNIYAREFLFIDSKLSGLEEALNKTEHAEKIHQEMLKDISTFLSGRGIIPYESGSIDLMYNLDDSLNVFEIKSTNVSNILAQAAKGAFQLACYQNELSKSYDKLNARLILHKTESNEIEEYALDALHRLGVRVLFYDPTKPWPNRIKDMPMS
jgi:hypothetical protein